MNNWFPHPFILIVANGELVPGRWLKAYLDRAEAIIAANGGAAHVLAAGGRPDVVIGDLDSLPAAARTVLLELGTRFYDHPVAKDETDLELALGWGLENYPDRPVLICGVLGGRWDQSLANMLLLTHSAWREREIYLVDKYQRAWLLRGEVTVAGVAGDRLSLVPLSDDVRVTVESGLRWPLREERLPLGSTRGVSNEFTAAAAHLTVHSGLLLGLQIARVWQR